ncbi:MAG TPA: LysM peptidoglycan-binding domain-containing protein [Flavobacteriaceae bacterium]|nr:LysM peptidoglycan-binding domain-containing protein [Flavobacteriaceae bacterium]
MKHFISLVSLLLFISCGTIMPQQQQYRTHTVAQGETVYKIAHKYGVTEDAILKLNPEAENGIYPNTVLKIPRESSIFDNADVYFKEHEVAPKETLYGIAKEYGVSEALIKKYNKHLYTEQIRAGETIRIPIKKRNGAWDAEQDLNEKPRDGAIIHVVEAKETLSSISRKYNVSVAELRSLNPEIGDVLPEGIELLIPVGQEIDKEEGYEYYEVQPAEGFFSIQRRFGITKEEIIAHNPLAGDGLKAGMILKIPTEDLEEDGLLLKSTIVDLREHIKNKSNKNIALMLPLRLSRVQDIDSLEANTRLLQNDATLQVALDFYRGAIMAAEDVTNLGIPVNLRVFDTEGSPNKVSQIISSNNFKQYDAVIGPVLASEVERAANDLQREEVAVFSPLTNRTSWNYRNLFQTLPTDEELENLMYTYIEKGFKDKNIIFITDLNSNNTKYNRIQNIVPGITTVTPTEKGFLYINEIQPHLSKEQTNWIILESKDPLLVSNVVGMLNGIVRNYDMQLLTTNKNSAYDYHDVSNSHLARLKFTFPSINKSSTLNEDSEFIKKYKERYQLEPNRYVVRGYDLTFDVLLRLASDKTIYKASEEPYLTEYIENKFQYLSKSRSSYKNKSGYIVQLNDDLNLVVIE